MGHRLPLATAAMGEWRQVPKLGSLQRWVRDCDAAGDDPRALEVRRCRL